MTPQAKWRAANPDRMKKYSENRAAKRVANRAWAREVDLRETLKKRYGITPAEYAAMLVEQDGCCAICGKNTPGGRGRWHVDHCSETGTVRRLLCSSCNPGLGFFKHDIALLQRAIDYLKTFT